MEQKLFRIVLTGIASNQDQQTAKERLATTFGTSPDKIGQLQAKLPVVVKSDVDSKTALKYRDIIKHAGWVCRIEPMDATCPAAPPVPERPASTAICPNCGYQPTTSDDPLLTAHDGQGECPSCGIIVAKFIKHRECSAPEEPPPPKGEDVNLKKRNSPLSLVLAHPWISLIVVAAIAVQLIVLFSRSTPSGKEKTSVKERVASSNPAVGDGPRKDSDSGLTVLPGQTREVVLISYLTYLHRDSFSPLTIKAIGSKIYNKWEPEGVLVEMRDIVITPISVSLWEQLLDNTWLPCYEGISSEGGSSNVIAEGKNFLFARSPAALVKKPDATAIKVAPSDSRFRKSTFTLYRLEHVLSVNVPGGEEFKARDLGYALRERRVCINTFLSMDVNDAADALKPPQPIIVNERGGGTRALLNTKERCIEMKHENRKEGLSVTPADSTPELTAYTEVAAH